MVILICPNRERREEGGCQREGGGALGEGVVVELVLVLIPVFNPALGNHQLQVVSCWCECVGVQHTINYTTAYRGYLPVESEPLTTLPRDCLLPPFLRSYPTVESEAVLLSAERLREINY